MVSTGWLSMSNELINHTTNIFSRTMVMAVDMMHLDEVGNLKDEQISVRALLKFYK